MARPPRGRLPGSDSSSDGTGADELPLDLPRVDPIRPRLPRPSISPRIEPKFASAEDTPSQDYRPIMPPVGPALRATDPERSFAPPEKVDDPFDYYALPNADGDPLSRPLGPTDTASSTDEFLTSKYYTPRTDFSASRDIDAAQSPSTRARRMPGFDPDPSLRDGDDTPLHLRHLPSRVRDHLRVEPKMPTISEPLGSFAQAQPSATQLRARSGVPLPLAPEIRAPVPTDIRVSRHLPRMPEPERSEVRDEPEPYSRSESSYSPAAFDSSSDEAVTDYDPTLPPLVVPDEAQTSWEDESAFQENTYDEPITHLPKAEFENRPNEDVPPWMKRSEPIAERALPSDEWAQDDALHALTMRLRKRAMATTNKINSKPGEALALKMKSLLAWSNNAVKTKYSTWQEAKAARQVERMMRNDARLKQRALAKPQPIIKQQPPAFDMDRQSQNDIPMPVSVSISNSDAHQPTRAFVPEMVEADARPIVTQPERRGFWQRIPRAPKVRVLVEANRTQRRKKQSRLYEDIVAWIVVPPFIIGMIYGTLELAKFLSNSPLGKLLSGQ